MYEFQCFISLPILRCNKYCLWFRQVSSQIGVISLINIQFKEFVRN